jgi:hypothetical protein
MNPFLAASPFAAARAGRDVTRQYILIVVALVMPFVAHFVAWLAQ